MNDQDIIAKTADEMRRRFSGEGTGHDWWHMYRVWQLAKTIAAKEKAADQFVVELAALLHDIADWKFHAGSMEAGPQAAREWLESLGVNEAIIVHIEDIIRNVSFKGAGVASNMKTIEGKIVHDADKLDAMGAIGIARAFAYGGANNREMHDPAAKPLAADADFAAYSSNKGSTINHFYEKILLLKGRFYTDTAKQMAEHRHTYIEQFLDEFYAEWEGKS